MKGRAVERVAERRAARSIAWKVAHGAGALDHRPLIADKGGRGRPRGEAPRELAPGSTKRGHTRLGRRRGDVGAALEAVEEADATRTEKAPFGKRM